LPKNYGLVGELTNHNNKVKPIPGRFDYRLFNYCSICGLKYSKEILRCKACNQKVRTIPWHRSKTMTRKRF